MKAQSVFDEDIYSKVYMIHVEYESLFFSMKRNYINAVFYSFCTWNVKYVKGKIILLVFDG